MIWQFNKRKTLIQFDLLVSEAGHGLHDLPQAAPMAQQHIFMVVFWFLGFEHTPKIIFL